MAPIDLQPFVRLLEQRIGLDAASIGHDEVGRALRTRLAQRGHGAGIEPVRLREYYQQLREQGDEWDEFVEHVLVPETWFFREPSAFELLAREARGRLVAGRPCRVLSVPCATGEEPYSIAIALDEAGLAPRDMTIDAVDISRRSLERAAAGVYGKRAVRHVGPERLDRSFTPVEGGYRVNERLRARVAFARGNLMDGQLLARRRYDVVFCRNVLIYFTAEARARVLESIASALADDGLLISGHAEGSAVVAPRFVSAGVPRTFAYRKAGPGQRLAAPAPRQPVSGARPTVPPPPRAWAAATGRPVGSTPVRLPAPPAEAAPTLAEIETLADAGDLPRALKTCQRHLASTPGSAQGYYLLGVIQSAMGSRDAAEAALRRAVYLDPGHVAALEQLASERRRAGDLREAAQLTRRAGLVRARQR